MEAPEYINPETRQQFLYDNGLRFLRQYQINALKALQESVRRGNQRFLFEMATGTGKTLTSAAVIRLFLRSGNANRVLFLVDRIELENQAKKNFQNYLAPDSVRYPTAAVPRQRFSISRRMRIRSSTLTSFAPFRYFST